MRFALVLVFGVVVSSCSPTASPPTLPPAATVVQTHGGAFSPDTPGYQSLYRFAGQPVDGAQPRAGLMSFGGTMYGTTTAGGKDNLGSIYTISPSGDERLLFSFPPANNGLRPESRLVAMQGTLWGASFGGGGTDCPGGCGTIFKVTPSGEAKEVYGFTGSGDAANPIGDLIAVNGTLYGTTLAGGCANSYCNAGCNCGTVFSFSVAHNNERILHSFIGPNADGGFPVAGVTYARGALYGVTPYSAFRVGLGGSFALLHRFGKGNDGANAQGTLLFFDGALYGTTSAGGAGCGNKGCGTIFKMTTSGNEQVLYRFRGGSDGRSPMAGLIAVNGRLYGTTSRGGGCSRSSSGCGTIFKISPAGREQVLYRFKGGSDGEFPGRGNLLASNGALYGTTERGGAKSSGTVFKFVP